MAGQVRDRPAHLVGTGMVSAVEQRRGDGVTWASYGLWHELAMPALRRTPHRPPVTARR